MLEEAYYLSYVVLYEWSSYYNIMVKFERLNNKQTPEPASVKLKALV